MKISVIGANSYIARNLIFLLKRRFGDSVKLFLYDYQEQHADLHGIYTKINIFDSEDVKKINLDCDVIFFFVGKTGNADTFDIYSQFIDINEKALLNVLFEYVNQNSNAKIVFPSTRLIYKGQKGHLLSENDEKEFKTVYSLNKFSCEQYLAQFNVSYGVHYIILRISLPYGTLVEGASSYGTADFMISKASTGHNIILYGDGKQRRTITFIEDLCNIMIDSGISTDCVDDVFNVGGEDYSLFEMATLIANKFGVEIECVDWPRLALIKESGDTVFSDAKLSSVIDLSYNTTFEEWIKR